ncbi:MAG: cell division protein FtsZ [Bacteroidota bacterium]
MSNNENNEFESISFDLPKNQSNVIKVIGVGGGGSNAINHMFRQGIRGVDFVVCNTDSQALENSPVPTKIQLGVNLTEGLGAGANPEIGEKAALESFDDIKNLLSTNTKMVFITAGMGGGTGTGAAPIIAKQAKEMDILTVGIVTSPFQFEGRMRNEQAQIGVEKLRAEVDSLIVINNNKLREVYGNLGFKAGFSKADEVLATASRGIAEVITHHYTQNIDLKDAKTVLSNSGTAIMGSAAASGSNRSKIAIEKALDSPLLNDNKISGAQNVLLLIVSGTDEITLDEIGEINDHIQDEAGHSANIIMGVGEDESLEDSISVTIIATGFNTEQQDEIVNTETKKIIHTLEDEQKAEQKLSASQTSASSRPTSSPKPEKKIIHSLKDDSDAEEESVEKKTPQKPLDKGLVETTEEIKNLEVDADILDVNQADFEITDMNEVEEQEDANNDAVNAQEEMPLTFDFPDVGASSNEEDENSAQEETISTSNQKIFQLEEEEGNIQDIEVNEFVDVSNQVNSSNQSAKKQEQRQVTRYNLDDYMEFEKELDEAKPQSSNKVAEPDPLEPVEKKSAESELEEKPAPKQKANTSAPEGAEIDPMNSSINELAARAAERRAKMKKFNYQFRKNQNIDEIEKQPAYKRAGVDIDHSRNQSNKRSRTSIQNNENGDIDFRSNNSFLHDNVD